MTQEKKYRLPVPGFNFPAMFIARRCLAKTQALNKARKCVCQVTHYI